jgi:hypothetical protein
MPAVKFSARLDLEQIIRFFDGHEFVPIRKWRLTVGFARQCAAGLLRLCLLFKVLSLGKIKSVQERRYEYHLSP